MEDECLTTEEDIWELNEKLMRRSKDGLSEELEKGIEGLDRILSMFVIVRENCAENSDGYVCCKDVFDLLYGALLKEKNRLLEMR